MKLSATLDTLKQVAAVQFHRTPLVPYFPPTPNPDRLSLMENIKAVAPNHTHRVESIEMAECVQHRKKELVMKREGIKRFESQLRIQRELLHKMDSTSELENRQAKKMIQLYMDEKAQREAELAREIKLERKVAERKHKEERERVKERLQRQREEEKKKTRVEQLRGRGETDQLSSTQSSVGDDGSSEWYHHGDGEEESIHFSSSFSSTASLLEHVRSMNGWSSDNASLQEKDGSAQVKEEGNSLQENCQLPAVEVNSGQHDEAMINTHQSSEYDSGTVEETSAKEQRNHHRQYESDPRERQSSGDSRVSEQVLPAKFLKPSKKVKQESRQPQANSNGQRNRREKVQSLAKETSAHRSKYEAKLVQQKKLNNETRSAVQSPTTGLQSIFRANQTQGLPHKHTNQVSSHTRMKKMAQPVRQSGGRPAVQKLNRKRVPLNDTSASPSARRVASSETILDNPRSKHGHSGPAKRPISTATQLAQTPPKVRKSTGSIGVSGDQAGIYDLLEKKPADPKRASQQKKRDERLERGFQTPTFDPHVRASEDESNSQPSGGAISCTASNSQPENLEFIVNPSYESRATATSSQRKEDSAGEREALPFSDRESKTRKLNGPVDSVGQSFVPTSKKARQVVISPEGPRSPRVQLGPNRGWQNSESDSSETSRVRSGLSNHSSPRHSGQQSNSSAGFSSSGHSEATPISHTLHSHVSSRTSRHLMQPHMGGGSDDPRAHSGLPVPRKRYQSHPRDHMDIARGRPVAPHPPPHRPTTQVPMPTVHDEGALTSYPRFQRREDHQARLHMGSQPARSPRHRTRQMGVVLPGTGQQVAQVSRPRPDHAHVPHPPKNSSSRHSEIAGSLV